MPDRSLRSLGRPLRWKEGRITERLHTKNIIHLRLEFERHFLPQPTNVL